MANTVNIKWHDGTIREVEKDTLVKVRGGGIFEAKRLRDLHVSEHWDGITAFVEGDEPPLAKPEGIDPKSFKNWTLCEIDTFTGIVYREVKDGQTRFSDKISVGNGFPHEWRIIRAIHRPTPGMNLIYTNKDGKVIEMHTYNLEIESATTDCEVGPLTENLITSFRTPRTEYEFSGTLSPNGEGHFMKVIDNG